MRLWHLLYILSMVVLHGIHGVFTPEMKNESNDTPKYAYVSLLCNKALMVSAQVMIQSFMKTKPKYPLIIMILNNIDESERHVLNNLGAKTTRVKELKYPFPITSNKILYGKICRYTKLHAWSFDQFEKLVFLDLDTMFSKNIDDIFNYPCPAAMLDLGGVYNTGLFLFKPSKKLYKQLKEVYMSVPSYNLGDQGFINTYFKDQMASIPLYYNTMVKHKMLGGNGMKYIKEARMIHLTSETKPWSFYTMITNYKENLMISVFYIWMRHYMDLLNEKFTEIYKNNINIYDSEERKVFSMHNLPYKPIDLKLTKSVCKICNDVYNTLETYPDVLRFTLIIYNISSQKLVDKLIEDFEDDPYIAEIYIRPTLRNHKIKIPTDTKKIKLLLGSSIKGCQYLPITGLNTHSVCLYDGANEYTTDDKITMRHLFMSWKTSKDHVHGITKVDMSKIYEEDEKIYLLDSHMSFFKTEYLLIYRCLLPPILHRINEEMQNDLTGLWFNVCFSLMMGQGPVYVKKLTQDYVHPIYEGYGITGEKRYSTTCKPYQQNPVRYLTDNDVKAVKFVLQHIFNKDIEKDHLPYTDMVFTPYTKIPVTKMNLENI